MTVPKSVVSMYERVGLLAQLLGLLILFIPTLPIIVCLYAWSCIVDRVLCPWFPTMGPKPDHCILVTGCGAGIGLQCALDLSRRGYYVFAGVRDANDIGRLTALGLPNTIHLDITSHDSIVNSVATISGFLSADPSRRFVALVNNAGVAYGAPLEQMPSDQIQRCIGVNLSGTVDITREYLPLARRHHGRIITIGSMSSVVPTAGSSVYCASKAGLRALALSLRQEMAPLGVAVSLIEPGPTTTAIIGKLNVPTPVPGGVYNGLLQLIISYATHVFPLAAVPCSASTDPAIFNAITSSYPRAIYEPSLNASIQSILSGLPAELQIGQIAVLAYRTFHNLRHGWSA
jgi:NAD(P)-dependent dehydrogenase (short-subunit alcohol dehydrogenase family)